jgi:hypothetical protein
MLIIYKIKPYKLHNSQSLETVKYVMSPAGLWTKNDCAGEGQQKFSNLAADWHGKQANIKINI